MHACMVVRIPRRMVPCLDAQVIFIFFVHPYDVGDFIGESHSIVPSPCIQATRPHTHACSTPFPTLCHMPSLPHALHPPPSTLHLPPSTFHPPPSALRPPPSALHLPPSATHTHMHTRTHIPSIISSLLSCPHPPTLTLPINPALPEFPPGGDLLWVESISLNHTTFKSIVGANMWIPNQMLSNNKFVNRTTSFTRSGEPFTVRARARVRVCVGGGGGE